MIKPQIIWIVMEPKRGDYNRICSTSHLNQGDAVRKAIRRWLPEDLFPVIPGDTYYGDLSEIWTGMKRAGWDITEVDIGNEGEVI
jgi:hypothetical protein